VVIDVIAKRKFINHAYSPNRPHDFEYDLSGRHIGPRLCPDIFSRPNPQSVSIAIEEKPELVPIDEMMPFISFRSTLLV
jgi:hypothetical protein